MAIIVPAIALMACALITFNWSWKKLPDTLLFPKETLTNSQSQFPFLSAAYLLAGCVMVKNLLAILFKSQLRIHLPDAATYWTFMSRYSLTVGSSTVLISILWLVIGTWLLLKKGWRTTAIYGSLSIFMGGLIFLSVNVMTESISWLNQGIYTALLGSTTSALFFPLIQILYLCLPYQMRFRAKVTTEMIALPLMESVPSLTIQGLIVIFGSLSAIAPYIKTLVPIFIVLLIIASVKASSKFSDNSLLPPPVRQQ